jgi:hypothetical protein
MNRQLNIAVFAPESSMDEGYRDLIRDRYKFEGSDIETGMHFIDGIESLRSHNFSYAFFHYDWYERYKNEDIRALLDQLTYSYWHGGITPNFDNQINEIIKFLGTEKGDDYREERFYKSLGNLSTILPA